MSPTTAVITGGGTGIGSACAERLAQQGHDVILTGRRLDPLEEVVGRLRSAGHVARARVCDITDEQAVRELFAEIETLGILVNNAGAASSAPLTKTTVNDVRASHEINAVGSFLCAREALAGMRRHHGWGRIVTVASVNSLVGAPYTAAYTMAKHAALGLSRSIAAEVRGTSITANAVCPTYVRTPMTESTLARIADKTKGTLDDAASLLEKDIALGRLLEPAEVAHAVAFLCSDLAGAINGQALVIDGGTIQ